MVVQAGQLNHVPGCQQAKTSRMSLRVLLEKHSKNSGIQRVSNERIFSSHLVVPTGGSPQPMAPRTEDNDRPSTSGKKIT